ncbi:MAG: bifunctional oligoribonuclease/PAP phosphatase NrnA [Candidatus Saccharimonadales bacterium]
MDNSKQQLVERIKAANNVLVTVSRNPSVDALSALLGLTLVLNKQGKHAAAVFSGLVPSNMEFLQPGETIEKNTDSLRDFIIALDKSKADKLRYKVEDNVVKIFITPYKTSISQEDFEFSEGDFNIDVVIALGVKQQEELDEAITSHGRILHDATVATINTEADAGLGSINWAVPQASSLCELVSELTQQLGSNLLDEQIATALLTGVVAETDRFSNNKTSSVTMSVSATLMKAGANQQLVASKLDEQIDLRDVGLNDLSSDNNTSNGPVAAGKDDGTIRIDHEEVPELTTDTQSGDEDKNQPEPPVSDTKSADSEENNSQIGNHTTSSMTSGAKLITEPPTFNGALTANSKPEELDPTSDPLTVDNSGEPGLNDAYEKDNIKAKDLSPMGSQPMPPQPAPPQPLSPPPSNWTPPPPPMPSPPINQAPTKPSSNPTNIKIDSNGNVTTLEDLEESVDSPHLKEPMVNEARSEVNRVYNESPSKNSESLPPLDSLNAQQLGNDLHPIDQPPSGSSSAPPPVPPPIPFQFGNQPPSQ